jgi:hypothetical protein
MDLTPEERQKIYLEEKARYDAQEELKAAGKSVYKNALATYLAGNPSKRQIAFIPCKACGMPSEMQFDGCANGCLMILVKVVVVLLSLCALPFSLLLLLLFLLCKDQKSYKCIKCGQYFTEKQQ